MKIQRPALPLLALLAQGVLPSTAVAMDDPPGPAAVRGANMDIETRAMALYLTGLEQIARGQLEDGRGMLLTVVREYPETDAGKRAAQTLEKLEPVKHDPVAAKVVAENGRGELIVSQTLMGAYFGAILPVLADIEEGSVVALGSLIGAAAGLTLSTTLTKDTSFSLASAEALWWGELWGAGTVNLVTLSFNEDLDLDRRFLFSQVVGAAAGGPASVAAQRALDLSPGQVSLSYTSGLWAAIQGELLALTVLADGADSARPFVLIPALAGNAALVAMMSQAPTIPISRSRVRLVNLGGYLGALVVGAGMIVFDIEPDSVAGVTVPFMVATGGGLAVAWKATEDWDREEHPEIFAQGQGSGVLVWNSGKMGLGSAAPQLSMDARYDGDGRLRVDPVFQVNLASGTW